MTDRRPAHATDRDKPRDTATVPAMPPDTEHPPDRLITDDELAAQLRISTRTLHRWAARGDGPPAIYRGPKFLRYRPADVDAWLDAHVRTGTAAGGGDAA